MPTSYHYGRQRIDANDIESVIRALKSDFLSQGPCLKEFESKVAKYCGARHCIAVSNGTDGLHLALRASGLGRGATAVTAALSFVATANAIRFAGAAPEFVDVCPDTFNVLAEDLDQKLVALEKAGRKVDTLVPVHFAGEPCGMAEISDVARRHNCKIVEDACQAFGGAYQGRPVGNCRYSEAVVFSLHPVKSITSAEGGLVLTDDDKIARTVRAMRAHGIERGPDDDGTFGPWHAEMRREGFNCKITELQCALGSSQLDKLYSYIKIRAKLVARYRERLNHPHIGFQRLSPDKQSANHLMVALFDHRALNVTKRGLYEAMKRRGVHLYVHYYPIPLHAFYRGDRYKEGDFPNAEKYYQGAFSLPLHPNLTMEDVDLICDHLLEVLG
ncbi:MAG: DegT/DnrJ/EryC1/StrS family aminotransferase [Myxococcota bacterium]|nr:DegT/DnrJ/EryC1/StrS family aminotransferase [Myxococcota bacterium]